MKATLNHYQNLVEGIAVVNMYLSWLQNVFVQIDKSICTRNSKKLSAFIESREVTLMAWGSIAVFKMCNCYLTKIFALPVKQYSAVSLHCVTHAIPLFQKFAYKQACLFVTSTNRKARLWKFGPTNLAQIPKFPFNMDKPIYDVSSDRSSYSDSALLKYILI